MRRPMILGVATIALNCLLWTGHAQTPPDPNAAIREVLNSVIGDDSFAGSIQLDEWPADTSQELGFKFDKGDYSALNSYTIDSDTSAVFGKLAISWNLDTSKYEGVISRTIVLKHDEATIEVRIRIASRHAWAKWIMVAEFANKWDLRSNPPRRLPVWGPDFGVEAGHILLLHDEDRGESWDGNNSRDLSCVQHNILIDLKKSEGCTVNLPNLAAAMVSKIAEQETARVAASAPLRPTVTVTLSQNQIDFPAMDAADNYLASKTINVTVATSGWTGNVQKYGFQASKGHPVTGVSDGKAVYDDTKIIYRPSDTPSTFDEVSNPTTVKFVRNLDSNDYHVAVAVWGDNLVPTFAFDTINIVRGK